MNKDVTNTYKYHEHCCAHVLYKIVFVYYMNSYYELIHKFLSNHSPFCIRLLNRPNCRDIFHFNIYNTIPLHSLKYLFVNWFLSIVPSIIFQSKTVDWKTVVMHVKWYHILDLFKLRPKCFHLHSVSANHLNRVDLVHLKSYCCSFDLLLA